MKKVLAIYMLLLVLACNDSKKNKTSTEDKSRNKKENTTNLLAQTAQNIQLPDDILDGMFPPHDVDENSSALEQAIFAWKEMIALSWQSTYNTTSFERGRPDKSWTYKAGTPQQPMVWETYAHRLEYRPKGDVITKAFDSAPAYAFDLQGKTKIDWGDIKQDEHFILLDEDNEIGSCYLFGGPNNPSAAKPEDKVQNLVMYMAKLNRTEYNYRKNFFNSSQSIAKGTAASKLDIQQISAYKDEGGKDPCGSAHFTNQGKFVFPCGDNNIKGEAGEGVIEVKTAWRPLQKGDKPNEYLKRSVIVFDEVGEDEFKASLQEYVLIGMHIIQKTKNFPEFFIATWEHNNVETHGFGFVAANPKSNTGEQMRDELYQVLSPARHDSSKDGGFSKDDFTYNKVSDAIQTRIKAANPNHFLANYRLTGYQSNLHPNKSVAERKKVMPAYYLANYVIESDATLADFSGSGQGKPFNDQPNLYADGKHITVGGCSGCHGVAQAKLGSDFSFISAKASKILPAQEPDVRVLSNKELADILVNPMK